MTVDKLIALATEWRDAQVGRAVSQMGSNRYKECLATTERVTSELRKEGLNITTDDWSNVVIQMPLKL